MFTYCSLSSLVIELCAGDLRQYINNFRTMGAGSGGVGTGSGISIIRASKFTRQIYRLFLFWQVKK